jgi:hypothetical protein
MTVILSGCGGSEYYKMSYQAVPAPALPVNAVPAVPEGEPRLIFPVNMDEVLYYYSYQNYAVLGESLFNGPAEDAEKARHHAKSIGASHVFMASEYLYMGSKKAHYYKENFYLRPTIRVDNGYIERGFEKIADPISIPYRKEFPIYKQRAIYMVKLQ